MRAALVTRGPRPDELGTGQEADTLMQTKALNIDGLLRTSIDALVIQETFVSSERR